MEVRTEARTQLLEQAYELEKEIYRVIGELLPLRWPRKIDGEHDSMALLAKATETPKFTLRLRQCGPRHRRHYTRLPFWSCNGGGNHYDQVIDHVNERTSADDTLDPEAAFSNFVELVRKVRLLRGYRDLMGVIENGFDGELIRELNPTSAAEFEFQLTVLPGNLSDAARGVTAHLDECVRPYDEFDLTLRLRRSRISMFHKLALDGRSNENFRELLCELDMRMTDLVRVVDWQRFCEHRLGVWS
jgi:hypothetical protein